MVLKKLTLLGIFNDCIYSFRLYFRVTMVYFLGDMAVYSNWALSLMFGTSVKRFQNYTLKLAKFPVCVDEYSENFTHHWWYIVRYVYLNKKRTLKMFWFL